MRQLAWLSATAVVIAGCVAAPPVPCTNCDGGCVALESDVRNCGACGKACPQGQVCRSSACAATCAAGQTVCGAGCVDPKNDPANCGMCGMTCAADQYCAMGMCEPIAACGASQTKCSGQCVNTASDNVHCGGCGNACTFGRSCVDAGCSVVCMPGLTDCSGTCSDLLNSERHCGACGKACLSSEHCTMGSCVDTFSVPRLCSQLKQSDGGFPARPQVFAFGRAEGPMIDVICPANGHTYLPVPQDGGMVNFSRRACGGAFTSCTPPGGDVFTRWTAVRMDYLVPNDLVLVLDDFTYSASTGMHRQCNSNPAIPCVDITQMPYSVAASCIGVGDVSGTANVTLTGRPLAIANEWIGKGFGSVGGATFSSFRQVANIVGGGFCGDAYPIDNLMHLRLCQSPRAETCDRVDNDCNGIVDDVRPDAGNAPDGGCL